MLKEIEQFVNWVRRRNAGARTWRDYGYDLKQFVKLVGDKPPNQVSLHDVDRFVQQQVSRGLSAATINRRLAAVMSLYTFLADEEPSLVCPVLPHRHTLRPTHRLPRPLQSEVVEKFLAVIDSERDRAMVLLMLRCGLRLGEVARLQVVDLYLAEALPRLVVQGKGGKARSTYLSPQAERGLRAYLRVRPKVGSPYVFVSYLGQGMSTTAIHKRLDHYRQRAGVSLTAHQLRHTFANDLLNAEVPVTTIQKLLGHVWLETTQGYVAANDRQVQQDVAQASRRLAGWR